MEASKPGKVDRRSPEYVFKSGVAGGIAGCAVRSNDLPLLFRPLNADT
jgi:hypothetical protein